MTRVRGVCFVVAVLTALLPAAMPAHAGSRDFSLLGLGRPQSAALDDPAVARYRALAAELAMVVTPKVLAPAETLGMSGFEFSLALTWTGISADADYWNGSSAVPVFEGAINGGSAPGGFWTPTLQIRKGLPFSVDLGISIAYLAQSSMVALGLDAKVALFESYIPTWLPDFALRGGVGHLVGADELTQTTLELDLMTSYTFTYGGSFNVTPSLGIGRMFARTSTEMLDETPYEVVDPDDQTTGSGGSLYTFPTLGFSDNSFTRIFLGVRTVYGVATFGYFLDMGFIPSDIGAHTASFSHTLKVGFDV